MKEKVMLKKFYEKEVERKEAVNEAAKESSKREENRIKYDNDYPLVIDKDTQILELSILPDDDEDESIAYMNRVRTLMNKEVRKVVRIRFKDTEREYKKEDDEKNPYLIDITTTLKLEELEEKLTQCNDEYDIYELDNN